ncbi:MAG: U32 family peptidase [Paludibacteraceae bacterium]|nr:U32 family peptidase [Paludibacteraceae bacterium]
MEIELLSPAKNADIGIEAILHGADAVYIGASDFGARKAAGNSIEDIKRLVDFAHIYSAKVYVTVNTIIKDSEIKEVSNLITELYNIGVDALIVQDFGILKMDIPTIALHASTQMHNTTPEKVKFLEDAGFSQVVLARESAKQDIIDIHNATSVRLEAFVHGALCVSYSGRCYASEALCSRSANRGECAQICRLPFQLQDAQGHNLGTYHWLSLKDMEHSSDLEDMIASGVSSFKIEGRLKDADYVKNVTAYYNNKLNEVLAKHPELKRSSDGRSTVNFTPNIEKTFFRKGTTYFYNGRSADISSIYTPKSQGEYIGTVKSVNGKHLTIYTEKELHNGDGLCFFDQKNQFYGFRLNTAVNKVFQNGKLISSECDTFEEVPLYVGCKLSRNFDIKFNSVLSKPTAKRKIDIDIVFENCTLTVTDGINTICETIDTEKVKADKNQSENIKSVLSKLGDTPYNAVSVKVNTDYFFPISLISSAKRNAVDKLTKLRQTKAFESREKFSVKNNSAIYPTDKADYTENISNTLAKRYYTEHGVSVAENAFELIQPKRIVPIMYCKYCIRYTMGACRLHKDGQIKELQEPLHLIYKNYYLRLEFDCKNCMMKVYKE